MRVILFYSKKRYSSPKYQVKDLLKKENIKIKECGETYITLENNNQIIFKQVNLNRPADLYKYKENDIFCYVDNCLYAPIENDINKLSSLLKKKREFYKIDIEDILGLLLNYEKKTYYAVDTIHDSIVTLDTYKKILSPQYNDSLSEAKRILKVHLLSKIEKNNQIIKNYQKVIDSKEYENKCLIEKLNNL